MSSYSKTNCIDKKKEQLWVHVLRQIMQTCFWDYGRNSISFQITTHFKKKIVWWGRYIDDIILFFSGSEEELLDFNVYVNNLNENLKLSLEYDPKVINFLDLQISKDDQGYLHTSIFRKKTHRNTVLHYCFLKKLFLLYRSASATHVLQKLTDVVRISMQCNLNIIIFLCE